MSLQREERSGPSGPTGSKAWLQALFDSPMAIGFSRDGVTLDANGAYLGLFGYASVAELRGRAILEQIAPSHRGEVVEYVALRSRGGDPPSRYRTRGLRKDGSEFPFDVTTARILVEDGPVTVVFVTDVTERETTVDALRASEERFRTLAGAALEGVFLHADGKVVLANEAGAAMYGYDPASIIGVPILQLTAPEDRDLLLERVRSGTTDPYEGRGRRKDGTTFFAEVRGRALLHQGRPMRVAIIRDITQRRREEAEQDALAERVRHAQKLESLGVLAGGVAHDFNNILTVITNEVALAQQNGEVGNHLDSIALAAERAADLCRQLLAYAGKAEFARAAVDLSALVFEMSSMLEVSIAKKALLVHDLAPGLPTMLGDATQIRQVVMNLVLNASEALATPQGSIRIATGVGDFEADVFARSAAGDGPRPGTYVYLDVHDDGVGMDAGTVAQMFDPFFTTKRLGRGLGMAAVLGIVRGHTGAILVDSTPGAGTRVRVLFPVSAVDSSRRSPPPPTDLRGQGVVLLVDDERNVRISTRLLLQGFGFEVLVASDGFEAVEIFRANATRIEVVLLDLTMPRMDGAEAMRTLRGIVRDVPIVLTTGYGVDGSPDSESGAASSDRPDAVIAKPYTAEQLLGVLKKVIRPGR